MKPSWNVPQSVSRRNARGERGEGKEDEKKGRHGIALMLHFLCGWERIQEGNTGSHIPQMHKKNPRTILLSSTSLLICHRTGWKNAVKYGHSISAATLYQHVSDGREAAHANTPYMFLTWRPHSAMNHRPFSPALCILSDSWLSESFIKNKMASVYWFQLLRRSGFPTFSCFVIVNWTFLFVRVKPSETKWDKMRRVGLWKLPTGTFLTFCTHITYWLIGNTK